MYIILALQSLTISRSYPDDNCGEAYGLGNVKDPQTEFPNYLNHTAGKSLIAPYLNSSAIAQAAGKPFLMFETNTASCGGFPGISDAFGAALWGLDYGLQMAFSNFSGAMFHVGGQNVYYNVRYVSSGLENLSDENGKQPFTRASDCSGL